MNCPQCGAPMEMGPFPWVRVCTDERCEAVYDVEDDDEETS